jgi:hypothetical protein
MTLTESLLQRILAYYAAQNMTERQFGSRWMIMFRTFCKKYVSRRPSRIPAAFPEGAKSACERDLASTVTPTIGLWRSSRRARHRRQSPKANDPPAVLTRTPITRHHPPEPPEMREDADTLCECPRSVPSRAPTPCGQIRFCLTGLEAAPGGTAALFRTTDRRPVRSRGIHIHPNPGWRRCSRVCSGNVSSVACHRIAGLSSRRPRARRTPA